MYYLDLTQDRAGDRYFFENDKEILGSIKRGILLASYERLLFVELFYY